MEANLDLVLSFAGSSRFVRIQVVESYVEHRSGRKGKQLEQSRARRELGEFLDSRRVDEE